MVIQPVSQWFQKSQGPSRWVGLDIGGSSIKLIQVEETPAGIRVLKSFLLEPPSSGDQQAVDRTGMLEGVLKEMDVRDVHIAVSGPECAVRRVTVPPMSARELPEAVKWQVKDDLAFPVRDSILDFELQGEVFEKEIKKQDVLVAAAPRSLLDELVARVERSGARVASITPASLALGSAVAAFVPEARQGCVAVMEVGAQATHVAITNAGDLRAVRDIAIGSASMTDALVGEITFPGGKIVIDPSQAEGLKRRYGVLPENAEGATTEGIPLFHLASLMRPVLEQLLTEISRFIDFYKIQMGEKEISRLFLCGGGAHLKLLQSFLAEGLGLPVEVFNPLTRLANDSQAAPPGAGAVEEGPRLTVAMGLALLHGEGLNLLPQEMRRARHMEISWAHGILAAKVLGGAMLAFTLLQLAMMGILQWQIRREQKRWESLKPIYAQYMERASSRKILEDTMAQIEALTDQEPVWEGVFKELGERIPPTLELKEFTVSTDGKKPNPSLMVSLKGGVGSGETSARHSVSSFVQALEDSIFFKKVELAHFELNSSNPEDTRFEIEGTLE